MSWKRRRVDDVLLISKKTIERTRVLSLSVTRARKAERLPRGWARLLSAQYLLRLQRPIWCSEMKEISLKASSRKSRAREEREKNFHRMGSGNSEIKVASGKLSSAGLKTLLNVIEPLKTLLLSGLFLETRVNSNHPPKKACIVNLGYAVRAHLRPNISQFLSHRIHQSAFLCYIEVSDQRI